MSNSLPSQDEIDLERITELFDTALMSEDPRIKKALKQLLIIVALTEPDVNPQRLTLNGPLSSLRSMVGELSRRVMSLEQDIINMRIQSNTAPRWGTGVSPNTLPSWGVGVQPNTWTATPNYNITMPLPNVYYSTNTTTTNTADLTIQMQQDLFDDLNKKI